ncbi:MAG: outer membrane beta-barrel protein [Microscillaceae bacterium]|jgi:hypothetical protein|nr:outer membrane beta-barrel protein [Microscillaceae bacterium]
MKKIFVFLIFCFTFGNLPAQLRLGASFGYSIPTGDFGTINKNGFGAIIAGKYQISPRFALTNGVGFYAFGRSGGDIGDFALRLGLSQATADLLRLANQLGTDKIEIPKVNFFPINIGFEYYILTEKIRPYLGLDLGMYINDTEDLDLGEIILKLSTATGQPIPANLRPFLENNNLKINGNDTNFGVAPVVGCNYQLNERWSLDFNMKANALYAARQKQSALVLTFNLGAFFQIQKSAN